MESRAVETYRVRRPLAARLNSTRRVAGRSDCRLRGFDLRQDTALAEFVDEGDAFAGEAAEPVEVEDDEDLIAAQVVEAGGEVLATGRGAGGMILEHALAAGGVQCVELAVEDLAAFGGGDAGVADEAHGVCGPEKPLSLTSCRKEIIPGLSGRESGQSGAAGRLRGGSRQARVCRGLLLSAE